MRPPRSSRRKTASSLQITTGLFSRTLPFDWSELTVESEAQGAFLLDALAHGVGPHGLSIPVRSKQGHRGLFSISFARSAEEWVEFREQHLGRAIAIEADGHDTLVTQICVRGSEYLDRDAAFSVRDGLIADFPRHQPGKAPDGRQMDRPFHTMAYDFVLTRA